jgi:hypothetical protein
MFASACTTILMLVQRYEMRIFHANEAVWICGPESKVRTRTSWCGNKWELEKHAVVTVMCRARHGDSNRTHELQTVVTCSCIYTVLCVSFAAFCNHNGSCM